MASLSFATIATTLASGGVYYMFLVLLDKKLIDGWYLYPWMYAPNAFVIGLLLHAMFVEILGRWIPVTQDSESFAKRVLFVLAYVAVVGAWIFDFTLALTIGFGTLGVFLSLKHGGPRSFQAVT